MISPTFEPESAPGAGIAAFDKGVDTSLSWMERSQQMRSRDQEEQLRRQQIAQNEILRPVHEAQALADVAKARATVASAQLVQQYRQQAAVEAPQALADFLQITKIADLDEKAAALDAHAAKVAWLADIPEYKPLYDSIKDAQGKAHLDSIAMGKIAQAKDAVTQRAATAEGQIEQRAKAAELKATTDVQMQAMKQEMEKLKQEAESLRAEKANATKKEVAATAATAASQRPANQAAVKANESALQSGQAASQELVNVNNALGIINDPEFRTGTGAGFALKAKRLGNLLGMDVGDAPQAEQLQSAFGDVLLSKAKQMKGNFSDKDREAIERFSPSLAKTKEGNLALMNMLKQGYEKQVQIAQMVNDLRRQGASEREVQLEVNDFILSHPISARESTSPSSGIVIKSVKKIE